MHIALRIASACCASVVLSGSAVAQTDRPVPWFVVEVKCPADNAGVYESVSLNVIGKTKMMTAHFANNRVIKYSVKIDTPERKDSHPFNVEYTADGLVLSSEGDGQLETSSAVIEFSNRYRDQLDQHLRHYCLSEGDERIAAGKEIAENRQKFGIR
jgi:hypothetical protein